MKDKGGGWTEGGFTFTAEQEREIRRAFGGKFPEAAISGFMRSMTGIMTKVANDRKEAATDPRMARDRAEKVAALLAKAAALLAKAAHQIAMMTETEKDIFSLATGGDPVELGELVATLDKAAMGFARAADGHALGRGEKVAGPDAVAMFVAAAAAAAWREAFGVEPVEHDGADYRAVLQAILYNAGLPELGVDAIRTAIMGSPKNRK